MTAGNDDHDVDRGLGAVSCRVSAMPVGYVIFNLNQWTICIFQCTQTACH